jgi:hypothetical protein
VQQCNLSNDGTSPEWIKNPLPESDDYYYAYGVSEAEKNSFSKARKISRNNARSELAESLLSRITSSFLKNTELTQKAGVSLLNKTVEVNMQSQTDLFLGKAFVEQTWNDPKACLIWSKIRLSKKDYDESKDIVAKSIQSDISSQLEAMNIKLDKTNDMLANVKQETSVHPRKELMNRGIAFTGKEFGKAIMRADIEVMELFVDGGLTFDDAYDDDYMVRLERRLIHLSIEKLEKVLRFFSQPSKKGPDLNDGYLQHAAFLGSLPRVDLLLKYGADPKKLYSGKIDIGSMQDDAFKLSDASAQCVAQMMQLKTKNTKVEDPLRWKAVSKRLAPFKASTIGNTQLAKSIVSYDTYDCDQSRAIKLDKLASIREKSCLSFFANKSDSSLVTLRINTQIDMYKQSNSVFEVAVSELVPDVISGSFKTDKQYITALRSKLDKACTNNRLLLCKQTRGLDYPLCRG